MIQLAIGLYDAIILVVDSKDVAAGVSSPPQALVEREFLTNANYYTDYTVSFPFLNLYATALAAQNKEMRTAVLCSISDGFFPNLLSILILRGCQ